MFAILMAGIPLRVQISHNLPRQVVLYAPLEEALEKTRFVDRIAVRAGILLAPELLQETINETLASEMPKHTRDTLIELGFSPLEADRLARSFKFQIRLSKTPEGIPLSESTVRGLIAA